MPSDRSRRPDRPHFGYTGVAAQQGRVIVDRDFDAEHSLTASRVALDALAFVGPCGTPDDGYKITVDKAVFLDELLRFPLSPPHSRGTNLSVSAGVMYLGGQVVSLAQSCTYLSQPEWTNPTEVTNPATELVYLDVQETEVGGVEDADLLDVALGGPDTTQRLKLLQRIKRKQFGASDLMTNCSAAWKAMLAEWTAEGLAFDPHTMSLKPTARLQITFDTPTQSNNNPCDPASVGGYLGPDNQLVRLRVTTIGGQLNVVWSYDDASFLYRVNQVSADGLSLSLTSDPPDAMHFPMAGQWVEVLSAAAVFGDTTAAPPTFHYVAEPGGAMYALAKPYGTVNSQDPTNYLVFSQAPIDNFTPDPMKPYFVRIWQSAQAIVASGNSASVDLTESATGYKLGVVATISWPSGSALADGAVWEIAFRPNTPQSVYPAEYLSSPQPADGPRRWVCPLALIDWTPSTGAKVTDCRNTFENLVALTKRKPGCCTFSIGAGEIVGGVTLQSLIDRARDLAGLISDPNASPNYTICLGSATYALAAPLALDASHSGMTIEACGGAAILTVAGFADPHTDLSAFAAGLIQLIGAGGVTLRGLQVYPPEAPAPASILAGVGKIVANSGLNVAALGSPRLAFGIRAVNCANLTLEGCSAVFQAQRPDASADLIGAALFAQGDCPGLTVTDCDFVSNLPPTFNLLTLPATTVSPGFGNIITGLSEASLGNRATFLGDVGLTEATLASANLATHSAAVSNALRTDVAAVDVAVSPGPTAPPPGTIGTAATVPTLATADLSDLRMLAGFEAIIGKKQGQPPKPPVIATVGVWAADNGSKTLGVASLLCTLGDASISGNRCDELAFGIVVGATFDSMRIQDNLCLGASGGIWVTLTGAITPKVPQSAPVYYPKAEFFVEYQLLQAFGAVLAPPQSQSAPQFTLELIRRFIGATRLNAIIVCGNQVQNNTNSPTLSPPTSVAVSSCALLLALCEGVTDSVIVNEMSAVVNGNHCRSGSGMEAPSVLVTLGANAACAINGNVIVNAVRDVTAVGVVVTQPALSVEAQFANLLSGVSVSGNVIKGSSNLTQIARPFAAPANTMSVLNADPS